MPKIFISYTTKDQAFAKKLESSLASEGADAWLDERRLQVGDSLIEKISEAINASDYIVAVLSKSSVNSKWVQHELLWAMTKERELGTPFILPVVIEKCEIPSFLKDKRYIDFGDPKSSFAESMNKLLDKLAIAGGPERCEYCKNDLPLFLDRCPHCARSGPAPNVRAARVPVERETLDIRYRTAIKHAASRGCGSIVTEFEKAVNDSRAVIHLSKNSVMRLVSDQEMYSHYYRAIDTESGPTGEWDIIRETADTILFAGQKEHIRFAVLSLNGKGLSNYGECTLVLRDELIAHRASVFEENSSRFVERRKIKMLHPALPPGYRADWKDRGKLCVAKLAKIITPDTKPRHFSNLVLHNGATFREDEFIEVHIWGSLTIRAVERVLIPSPVREGRSSKALTRALRNKLERMGVTVET